MMSGSSSTSRSLAAFKEQVCLELERCGLVAETNPSEWRNAVRMIHVNAPALPHVSPFETDYSDFQREMFRIISGRDGHDPVIDEPCEGRTPPSRDSARCNLVKRRLKDALVEVGARSVVEFGFGDGEVCMDLARASLSVHGVDVCGRRVHALLARAHSEGLPISAERAEMSQWRSHSRFDAVVFNQAFHHCFEHEKLLRSCRALLNTKGCILFADEPIESSFYAPWGLRLDGPALWVTRTRGWMELGFREDYFLELLGRVGFRCERKQEGPGRGSNFFKVIRDACSAP
jgi:SAM-dependent methyltransferase